MHDQVYSVFRHFLELSSIWRLWKSPYWQGRFLAFWPKRSRGSVLFEIDRRLFKSRRPQIRRRAAAVHLPRRFWGSAAAFEKPRPQNRRGRRKSPSAIFNYSQSRWLRPPTGIDLGLAPIGNFQIYLKILLIYFENFQSFKFKNFKIREKFSKKAIPHQSKIN